ncbi:hypothetical protein WJX81_001592 [Elliptochloris bilobata]|uniref:Major facilitator superfamily (MFS) profile domain-containing protein n=1 Tax=Elliptochloris bilobata TaxID=381761 RepID=A0AAW1SG13_9CHLO
MDIDLPPAQPAALPAEPSEADAPAPSMDNPPAAQAAEAAAAGVQAQVDARAVPVRQYLEATVVPTLMQGLQQLVRERPDNPVEFLAHYLLQHASAAKAEPAKAEAAKAEAPAPPAEPAVHLKDAADESRQVNGEHVDIGLSNLLYGLGAGLFFVGYFVAQLPSNVVIIRVGAKRWLALLLFLWGVVTMCTAAIRNTTQFFIIRVFLGLAEGGCFPGTWWHLSLFLNTDELGLAYATVSSAASIAQVLGGPLAAGLLMTEGLGGLHGWQYLFIVLGAITVIYSFAFWLGLARTPGTAWFLKPRERHWLQQRQAAAAAAAAARSVPGTGAGRLVGGLTSWRLWYLSAAWFMISCSSMGVLFWVPLLLKAMLAGDFGGHVARPGAAPPPPHPHGADREQAWATARLALLSGLLFLPCACFQLLNAWSSKRRRERNLHAGLPVLLSGIAFMLIPLAVGRGGVIVGFIVLTIAAIGVYAVVGPIFSWPATFLHGNARATGVAVFNSFGSSGGPMIILGAMDLVAAVMLLCFRCPDLTKPDASAEALTDVEEPAQPCGHTLGKAPAV